ncbi:hypothetical protein B5X24_HaOG206840 [Helicoverpa armigera]|uniref:Uncharacterized protein n=1 Tax=Helicoverpa armigera TaxID=29058 RepID=A0A2W1BN15_HELAM|nr:hypothetical protein B5X24_HaOG206840 [Helicoverpa armigera]
MCACSRPLCPRNRNDDSDDDEDLPSNQQRRYSSSERSRGQAKGGSGGAGAHTRASDEYGTYARAPGEYGTYARAPGEYGSPTRSSDEFGAHAGVEGGYGTHGRVSGEYGTHAGAFGESEGPDTTAQRPRRPYHNPSVFDPPPSWGDIFRSMQIKIWTKICEALVFWKRLRGDRFRWELFKSVLWFTIGLKLFNDITRHAKEISAGKNGKSGGGSLFNFFSSDSDDIKKDGSNRDGDRRDGKYGGIRTDVKGRKCRSKEDD